MPGMCTAPELLKVRVKRFGPRKGPVRPGRVRHGKRTGSAAAEPMRSQGRRSWHSAADCCTGIFLARSFDRQILG